MPHGSLGNHPKCAGFVVAYEHPLFKRNLVFAMHTYSELGETESKPAGRTAEETALLVGLKCRPAPLQTASAAGTFTRHLPT